MWLLYQNITHESQWTVEILGSEEDEAEGGELGDEGHG